MRATEANSCSILYHRRCSVLSVCVHFDLHSVVAAAAFFVTPFSINIHGSFDIVSLISSPACTWTLIAVEEEFFWRSPVQLRGVLHWSWQLAPKGLLDKVKVRLKVSLEYRLTFTPWRHLVGSYRATTRGHQGSGSGDSTSTPWWRLELCMLVDLPHTHSSSDGAKR